MFWEETRAGFLVAIVMTIEDWQWVPSDDFGSAPGDGV